MKEVVCYAQVKFSDMLCALKIVHIVFIIFRRKLFEDICVGIILLGNHSVKILNGRIINHVFILSVNYLSLGV